MSLIRTSRRYHGTSTSILEPRNLSKFVGEKRIRRGLFTSLFSFLKNGAINFQAEAAAKQAGPWTIRAHCAWKRHRLCPKLFCAVIRAILSRVCIDAPRFSDVAIQPIYSIPSTFHNGLPGDPVTASWTSRNVDSWKSTGPFSPSLTDFPTAGTHWTVVRQIIMVGRYAVLRIIRSSTVPVSLPKEIWLGKANWIEDSDGLNSAPWFLCLKWLLSGQISMILKNCGGISWTREGMGLRVCGSFFASIGWILRALLRAGYHLHFFGASMTTESWYEPRKQADRTKLVLRFGKSSDWAWKFMKSYCFSVIRCLPSRGNPSTKKLN